MDDVIGMRSSKLKISIWVLFVNYVTMPGSKLQTSVPQINNFVSKLYIIYYFCITYVWFPNAEALILLTSYKFTQYKGILI
jgi:hypothetical protein